MVYCFRFRGMLTSVRTERERERKDLKSKLNVISMEADDYMFKTLFTDIYLLECLQNVIYFLLFIFLFLIIGIFYNVLCLESLLMSWTSLSMLVTCTMLLWLFSLPKWRLSKVAFSLLMRFIILFYFSMMHYIYNKFTFVFIRQYCFEKCYELDQGIFQPWLCRGYWFKDKVKWCAFLF